MFFATDVIISFKQGFHFIRKFRNTLPFFSSTIINKFVACCLSQTYWTEACCTFYFLYLKLVRPRPTSNYLSFIVCALMRHTVPNFNQCENNNYFFIYCFVQISRAGKKYRFLQLIELSRYWFLKSLDWFLHYFQWLRENVFVSLHVLQLSMCSDKLTY